MSIEISTDPERSQRSFVDAQQTLDAVRNVWGLSARQARVALALAAGRSYKEIAEDLGISFHTVNTHVKTILARTGAGSSRKLAALIHDLERNGEHPA